MIIENFSKWIELVVLPQNSYELVAAAFFDHVSTQFGASAEVLTNQGRVFLGSFEECVPMPLLIVVIYWRRGAPQFSVVFLYGTISCKVLGLERLASLSCSSFFFFTFFI